MEKEFDELRTGISNFPALLQDNPKATLASLRIDNYEISPTEPLHNLKGHLSNIIEEILVISIGKTHEAIAAVKRTVLCKDTICCSDLRKAIIIILIYIELNAISTDTPITQLYRTAVKISCLLYSHDSDRTPKQSYAYTITLFSTHISPRISVHNPICKSTSGNKKKNVWKILPFTSLPCCTAVYRTVSLSSLNTEQHERLFQQAKGISKDTTNHDAEHLILNIIQRLQFETTSTSNGNQESEIRTLAKAIGPMHEKYINSSRHSFLKKLCKNVQLTIRPT